MQSDAALLEALLAGDVRAFDALYLRHARHLFGFVRGHLRDAAEAEDVLHDTFMALLRDRSAARSAMNLRAWLFQVARNLCLNRQRTARRSDHAVARLAQTPADTAEPAEQALERRQKHEALNDAVRRMPEALASLFRLRAGGLSYEEMARVLAVPLGTVKSRMHQLVTQLREELSR